MGQTSAFAPRFWKDMSYPPGLENHPVHSISWFEAVMYAECAGKRLPTEAEWEKAARGTDERRWPWGKHFNEANALVWDRGEFAMTAAVDAHPGGASPYGVYEMAGNVEEWTADWYAADYYGRSPEERVTGPEAGETRVIRGGSWASSARDLRGSARRGLAPGRRAAAPGWPR